MRQRNSLYVALCCLASAVVLLAACSEEQILNNGKAKADMSFAVTDVQEAEEDLPKSRAYAASDYATHSIDFTEPAENACLQETTIEGVNPVKRNAATRAILESSINHDFGVFACKNGGNKPDFFYNEQVHSTGTMVNETSWAASVATTLKFYAIYPYLDNNNSNQKLVQASPGDMPYVDFTVSTNIANQTELMRAVTNDIAHADDAGRIHVVPLKFHHALTAIRFGVGSNRGTRRFRV